MTDTLTPERRSALMSRIQGGIRRNSLERAVHNWLKGHHIRHRMNPRMPGSPDAVLSSATGGFALFVDGCFWHACPRHYRPPKNPRPSWGHDLRAEERARSRRRRLLTVRWHRVWEHEVRDGSFGPKILRWLEEPR